MGTFHFFARRQYLHTALLPRKAKIIPFLIILNIECLDFQGIFMVQLHLSIYVRSPEKSKNHIPFINFISLFRRGELCSPLCFCFYTVTKKTDGISVRFYSLFNHAGTGTAVGFFRREELINREFHTLKSTARVLR